MITGINHITISVNDLNESFAFYKDVLNFKPIMKSAYSAYLTLDNIWFALQQEKDIDRLNESYTHIALNIPSNEYISIIDRLKNIPVKEWKINDTEGDSFYFLDPSGNKFEIHYSNLENRIQYGKSHWKDVEWFV